MLTAIPVLFGVTLVTFFLLDKLPGNAARQMLGAQATAEQVAALETRLALHRPAYERYWEWLRGLGTGDLGKSLASSQPVSNLLAERMPVTLELVGITFFFSLILSLPAALLAAHKPNGLIDRLTMLFSMAGLSMANYVLALLLVLVFAVGVRLFPSIGFSPLRDGVLSNVRSLTLPALAIAVPIAALYARFLRGDLIEQQRTEEYATLALAKGLSSARVLVRHVLPNSLFGMLTLVGLSIGSLLGGTVVVEQIFALPGMGLLLLQSVTLRDAPVVQGIVVILVGATVAANLVVDLLYAALDPRIRLDVA